MGRWEPDARGRLAQAAMALYAEQGFDQTTVAEIAGRAGLTERTFFRHFADKREVLFYGMEMMRDRLARAVADAPASATAMGAVGAALEAMAATLQENPERVRLRDSIVSAHPELRERELIKLAAIASALAGALRDRGIPEPAASLAAEAGVAVFKVAFARWISEPGQPDLPGTLRKSMAELGDVLGAGLQVQRQPTGRGLPSGTALPAAVPAAGGQRHLIRVTAAVGKHHCPFGKAWMGHVRGGSGHTRVLK